MKFIHYIEKIGGVDIFGTLSLSIFTLFFTAVLVWVFKTKKKVFDDINRLPLDN